MLMTLVDLAPLAAQMLLIGGTLLALSIAMYRLLSRVMWRVLAALVGPFVVLLAAWLYLYIRLLTGRPDGYVLDMMMLAPPFIFGLILPISAGMLLWVLATRSRVAHRRA